MKTSGMWMTAVGIGCVVLGLLRPVSVEAAEITFMTSLWNQDVQIWFEEEAIPQFEARHPGTSVRITYATTAEMHAKLQVSIIAGAGPDVYVLLDGVAREHAAALARPLDTYVRAWGELDDFIRPAVTKQRVDGSIYGIPNTLNLRTYAANVAMFEEAGLDPTAPLGDWPNFNSVVQTLQGLYAPQELLAFRTNVNQYVEQVLNEAGSEWLADDGRFHLDTPAGRAAIDQLIRVYQAGGASPTMFRGASGALRRGETPLVWLAVQHFARANDRLGAGSVVLLEPVRQTAVIPSTALAISQMSDHPDAAWDWIAFLSEPDRLRRFNDLFGRVAPRTSSMRSDALSDDLFTQQALRIAQRFGAPVGASDLGPLIDWGELVSDVQGVLEGTVTPQQLMLNVDVMQSGNEANP